MRGWKLALLLTGVVTITVLMTLMATSQKVASARNTVPQFNNLVDLGLAAWPDVTSDKAPEVFNPGIHRYADCATDVLLYVGGSGAGGIMPLPTELKEEVCSKQ